MVAIRKVTVLCTGVWGSQIALQRAVKGFAVPASGISVVAVDAARGRDWEFSRRTNAMSPGLLIVQPPPPKVSYSQQFSTLP
jgi:3-hydroxyacyl-CoA dehydrogenase